MAYAQRNELIRTGVMCVIACVLAFVVLPNRVTAIALAPGIIELTGKRGEVVEHSFMLINPEAVERNYFLGSMKFTQRDESGSPQFIPYVQDRSGLPEWIMFPHKQVTVPAQSKLEVPFSVVIPGGAESGTAYGAIVVSETPFDVVETNGVSVNALTAALVFMTVEGNTIQKAALLDFLPVNIGDLKTSAEGSFKYRVQNQGNVFVVPEGTVRVKDIFGRQVAVGDANKKEGRVLPGTTRMFEGKFSSTSGMVLGPVTAVLNVEYGQGQEPLMAEFSFWVVSWQPLTIIALVLIVLPFLLRRRKS